MGYINFNSHLSVVEGVANGVASLDATTKLPASQLPTVVTNLTNLLSTDGNGNILITASPPTSDNSTKLATTAYVQAQGFLGSTLTSAKIYVGNSTNVATAVSMSGDATISNLGVLTLGTTGIVPGTYGSATSIPSFTLDAKGRVTSVTTNTITTSTTLSGDVTGTGTGTVPTIVGKIGGQAVTLAGSLTTLGSYGLTLTATAVTSLTLPTSGTLLTTTGSGATLTGITPSQIGATSSSLASGNIYVGSITNTAASVAMAGDATIVAGGAITVGKIGGQPVSLTGSITILGSNALTLTTTGSTSLVLPTSGTLVTTNNGSALVFGAGSLTLAGNLVTTGSSTLNLITTGSTSLTLPTSGTLMSTTSSILATQLPASGVVNGSYGSATTVPVITVDTYGRLTGVSTATIAGGGSTTNTVQDFTGDGSTTSFILSPAPSAVNSVNVYINGVYQFKNSYTISGSSLQFSSAPMADMVIEVVYTAAGNTAFTPAFKNLIIGGDFNTNPWQRGTSSGTLTATTATYVADRWVASAGGTCSYTVSQQASGQTGYPKCLRVQRTASNAATVALQVSQVIETLNVTPFQGQQVTLTWQARCGATYSPTSSNMTVLIASGTGSDEGFAGFQAGTWAGYTAITNTTQAITTSWVTYTKTISIPSTATELAIQFGMVPTGTAGANDYFDINSVQLEYGSTFTGFEILPIDVVYQKCLRYYEKSYDMNVAPGTSTYAGADYSIATATTRMPLGMDFKVMKRVTPTMVIYDPGASSTTNSVRNSSNTAVALTGVTITNVSQSGGGILVQTGTTLTANQDFAFHWTSSAEL